ncbi:hypothetical protein F2Q69_00025235 [Brassica cretica]|uniref:Uncharacterized protein n=1 Tax=Brassica cretica TaxID=69181 RepID=A0A8S9Q3B4_BRACR|nr:hypothetical protein F2Q69_00025235 [Brassica cretica]
MAIQPTRTPDDSLKEISPIESSRRGHGRRGVTGEERETKRFEREKERSAFDTRPTRYVSSVPKGTSLIN